LAQDDTVDGIPFAEVTLVLVPIKTRPAALPKSVPLRVMALPLYSCPETVVIAGAAVTDVVTVIDADPMFPAASLASARNTCDPLAALPLFQEKP
jgi:hypothetical protein